jgi:hypothetical protein
MNIATSWNGVSAEHVSWGARGRDIAKQAFAQEKDMTPKFFVLTIAAVMAVAGSASAAGYSSTTPSKGGIAVSKATTEVEKAVGAGDKLTQKELNSAIPLNKVSNPVNTLATAKVDDRAGHIIGPVKSIITGQSGAPIAIHVDVGGFLGVGERVVSMNARNFTYVPDRNILLTRMTKAEVQKLHAVKG